jgi:hypothetical protein
MTDDGGGYELIADQSYSRNTFAMPTHSASRDSRQAGVTCPAIPLGGIALVASLTMQVDVHP